MFQLTLDVLMFDITGEMGPDISSDMTVAACV
jgi:hypothetical protein